MQNVEMKTAAYIFLGIVFAACMILTGLILHGPLGKETWPTLTSLFAVIAAVIGVLPALRVLQIQEDALSPKPVPYFDITSRYSILQLRIKNFGSGVAYDVRLHWTNQPTNHDGDLVTSLDNISVLVPQQSASTHLGTSFEMVRRFGDTVFHGECHYSDSTGRRFRQKFICSVDAHRKQLIHDDEMPKTLKDLQDIPKELARIAERLEDFKPRSHDC